MLFIAANSIGALWLFSRRFHRNKQSKKKKKKDSKLQEKTKISYREKRKMKK